MSSVAVFVSDFHLGTIDSLKDFDSFSEFENFLLMLHARFPIEELDLVLLGDVFDLWQVVPQSDLPRTGGILPEWDLTTIALELESSGEEDKLEKAIMGNAAVFTAIAGFLDGNLQRRVFFIPGNHDHSLVAVGVQKKLQGLMNSYGVDNRQLVLGQYYYENPLLMVYAEHGSQFDEDNHYADFDYFNTGEDTYSMECKGYFFVRLFWNLLESLDSSVENGPTHWYGIFTWLARNQRFALIPVAAKLFYDYEHHPKSFERISFSGEIGTLLKSRAADEAEPVMFPENLYKHELNPEAIFSENIRVENFYRRLYHSKGKEGERARIIFDGLLDNKRRTLPLDKRPTVGQPFDAELSLEDEAARLTSKNEFRDEKALFLMRDGYEIAARELFQPGISSSLKGQNLTPEQVKYVVFGHTHHSCSKELPNKAFYFNTGSWQTGRDDDGNPVKKLSYLILSRKSGQDIAVECDDFRTA
jgi:UDP-2,3-diacylglucosamine pyrophosphatase LpxH